MLGIDPVKSDAGGRNRVREQLKIVLRAFKHIATWTRATVAVAGLVVSIWALHLARETDEQVNETASAVTDIKKSTGTIATDAVTIKGLVESVEPRVSELRSLTDALSELYGSVTFPTIDDLYRETPGGLRVARISHRDRYGTASLIARLLINDYRREKLTTVDDRRTPAAIPRYAMFAIAEDSSSGNDKDGHLADGIVASALSHDSASPGIFAPLLLSHSNQLSQPIHDLLSQYWVELVEFKVVGSDLSAAGEIIDEVSVLLDGFPATSSTRIYGSNRYETALAALDELIKNGFNAVGPLCGDNGEDSGAKVAIVASGESQYLAAALPALPLSVIGRTPVLLYQEGSAESNNALIGRLSQAGISNVLLLGSEMAIAAEFKKSLERRGIDVVRIGGETRYATSVEFAEFALGLDSGGSGPKLGCVHSRTVAFVSSETDQDGAPASAGGILIAPLLAKVQGLMFLTEPDRIPSQVCQFFENHSAELAVENVWIVGGTERIDSQVADDIVDMVENGTCSRRHNAT